MNQEDKIQALTVLLKVNSEWLEVVLSDNVKKEILDIINKPTSSIKLIKK